MSQIPICTIIIASEIVTEDLASLEMAFQSHNIDLQKQPSRIVGADDILFIAAIMGGIASTANVIDYSIKVGKVMNNWRRSRREKGKPIKARLEHPEKPTLNLETATDEEVEEWLQ